MFKWFWKILCVVMCLGAPVHAQNVDELLDQLQQAPSPEIANELVSEIWPLWLYPETNSDQRPKMEQALRAMDRNNFAKADLILTDIITAAPIIPKRGTNAPPYGFWPVTLSGPKQIFTKPCNANPVILGRYRDWV